VSAAASGGGGAPLPLLPFSDDARAIIAAARGEAGRQGLLFAGREHLLLALLAATRGAAARALAAVDMDAAAVRSFLDGRLVVPITSAGLPAADVEFDRATRAVLTTAAEVALALAGDDAPPPRLVASHHLLLSLLEAPGAEVESLLSMASIDAGALAASIAAGVGGQEEEAATPGGAPSAESVREELVAQYRRYMASGGGADGFPKLDPLPRGAPADDDDIYN
jgi:ATP-dependent Clp protease ATP-binding subunit ClpA